MTWLGIALLTALTWVLRLLAGLLVLAAVLAAVTRLLITLLTALTWVLRLLAGLLSVLATLIVLTALVCTSWPDLIGLWEFQSNSVRPSYVPQRWTVSRPMKHPARRSLAPRSSTERNIVALVGVPYEAQAAKSITETSSTASAHRPRLADTPRKGSVMDENRIAGTTKNMGGKVEEGFGRVTGGNTKSQVEAIATEAAGAAQTQTVEAAIPLFTLLVLSAIRLRLWKSGSDIV